MTVLRLGLVGAGRIARDYIRVLETVPELSIVGTADLDAAARGRAASWTLAPTFSTVDRMLAETELDVVLIASPPATHCGAALQALDAGCHVFCEKPLATAADHAERMLAAARAADRVLMMASKFRFVDDVAEARRILQDGVIGDIAFYHNAFCSRVDMTERWNAVPEIAGGGVLIDNGTHSVDLARFLVGPIRRVSATFGPRVQPIDVEDSALLLFESERRTIGRIELSWSVDSPSEHFVEVHGAAGALQIGWRGSRYRTDGDWIAFGSGYDKGRAFGAQLRHFAAVVRGEAAPIIDDDDSLASVRIVEAAYRAAELGTWELTPSAVEIRS
ncbi:MAG: Gfo/Idh/MocA family oxidoreductase [Planctomycetes bacterium]|nr:Gfo/Idh/MocA family oxidoreductase [Planctomycetota bacterium]